MPEHPSEHAEPPAPRTSHRSWDELSKEAEKLASDPIDLVELRSVRDDMDAVEAPWPDD